MSEVESREFALGEEEAMFLAIALDCLRKAHFSLAHDTGDDDDIVIVQQVSKSLMTRLESTWPGSTAFKKPSS